MKISKMPPGLRRYWAKHKRPGHKVHTKTTKKRRHVSHAHHPRKHAHCAHANARGVHAPGLRGVKWCGDCGSFSDGERWHRPRR